MKELLKETNKSIVIQAIIYKILIYLCWFTLAILSVIFIQGNFSRIKLLLLLVSVFIIFGLRILFKHLYKEINIKAYYSIKHSIEMSYFKKLEYLDSSKLESLDKEFLSNKILEVTYNITKLISDIGEYMIPCLIGLIIFFACLSSVNPFIAILILIIIGILVYLEYMHIKDIDEMPTIYNDLLKDFIYKLPDIRKLNCFKFCIKKLDNNSTNDIIITKNVNNTYDAIYEAGITLVLFLSSISTVFLVENNITVLGLIIFYIIMLLKLKDLIYQIDPTIKNILSLKENKILLDSYFVDNKNNSYVKTWKEIKFKDGAYTYNDSKLNIKIPNFIFKKGDHASILGKAGQGKSTLLYILSGIYKLGSGNMFIDSNVTNNSIEAFFITRNTSLFDLSLRDNLTLGNKISDDKLIELINEINLTNWYKTLPNGLDTIIDSHTIIVNNKEREKLNILRSIITGYNTLLLDEPTYDLTIEDEKIIAQMMKKYYNLKSVIIVSHRPVLSAICDKHYFMKNHELLECEPLL